MRKIIVGAQVSVMASYRRQASAGFHHGARDGTRPAHRQRHELLQQAAQLTNRSRSVRDADRAFTLCGEICRAFAASSTCRRPPAEVTKASRSIQSASE